MDAYRIEDSIAQARVGMSRGTLAQRSREMRVSMLAVGAEPVELFATGANRKTSRFDVWLDRFWVPLFSASARPTTAAL